MKASLVQQIFLFQNAKWNYWIMQEFDSELYLIKLDFITTLKIALANELPVFYNIRTKLNTYELLDFKSRYNTIVNITNFHNIKLEKGNLMQNKLIIESSSTTYNLYFIYRGQTEEAENILRKYFTDRLKITNKGFF